MSNALISANDIAVADKVIKDSGYLPYISTADTRGVFTHCQLGDPNKRLQHHYWDWASGESQVYHVQSRDRDGVWQTIQKFTIDDLIAGIAAPALVGPVSDTMRRLALKLRDFDQDKGSYIFRAADTPAPGEQILSRINKHMATDRVRIIENEHNDPTLIFEHKPLGKDKKWQFVHQTTMTAFLGPTYRADAEFPAGQSLAGQGIDSAANDQDVKPDMIARLRRLRPVMFLLNTRS